MSEKQINLKKIIKDLIPVIIFVVILGILTLIFWTYVWAE